jgi:hypothetical protein
VQSLDQATQALANHLSTNGGSVSQAAKAKADRLKRNAVYRAHRREKSEEFVKYERASDQKFRDANKWARGFADAYPQQFEDFKNAMIREAMRQ